jgi:hypothetical protein
MVWKLGQYVARHHVGLAALFIALGGTAYAVVTIDGSQIANRSIEGKKLAAGSVGYNRLNPTVQSLLGAGGGGGGAGPAGPRGATGPQGPQGPVGATGVGGTNGTKGATGAKGATGTKGVTGQTGPTGVTGPTGRVTNITDSGIAPAVPIPPGVSTLLTGWSQAPPYTASGNFNAAVGVYTVPQTGTYLVHGSAYLESPGAFTTSETSIPTFRVLVNGVPEDSIDFPEFNVNIALVLTLRTPLSRSKVDSTQLLDLNAGDVIFFVVDNPTTTTFTGTGRMSIGLFAG